MLTCLMSCFGMRAENAGCCLARSPLHGPEEHVIAGQLACVSQQLCLRQLRRKQFTAAAVRGLHLISCCVHQS